jgi:hypothetical protein
MHTHLDSVANRALVTPAKPRERDLLEILAPYAADESDAAQAKSKQSTTGLSVVVE